jgi:hypothetical protein
MFPRDSGRDFGGLPGEVRLRFPISGFRRFHYGRPRGSHRVAEGSIKSSGPVGFDEI